MFCSGEVSRPAFDPLSAAAMSWLMLRSRLVWVSATSLQEARSLWAWASVATVLVQVTLWEKKEQPPSKPRGRTRPARRKAAVDRRVMLEAVILDAVTLEAFMGWKPRIHK